MHGKISYPTTKVTKYYNKEVLAYKMKSKLVVFLRIKESSTLDSYQDCRSS